MISEYTNYVHLNEITKIFGKGDSSVKAIKKFSLIGYAGELLLILGPSGSGKTTLLTLIAGLIKPTSGTVSLFGKEINQYSGTDLQHLRAERIGFIFQTFNLIDALTAIENISVVLRFTKKTRREAYETAGRLLAELKIDYLADKFPATMSQGEKQRVAIARAMANNSDLILADEPTGSLESKQGFEIIQLLRSLAEKNRKCIIVASHDLRLVDFADRIIKLEDGTLVKNNRSVPLMTQ